MIITACYLILIINTDYCFLMRKVMFEMMEMKI